ncbi:thioredoxin [Candidatus Peregrinibacteria bacterium RIFOXYB2_FULL_32_7]|nr:MAG: thioredoxin [Candidatus Peregrinibacteria bacterium RIFOXYB2_FULL_32_7]
MFFTDDNFQTEVLNQKGIPVLVDFYADWCGPCQMLSPIIDELAEELKGKIKMGKVNVDESGEIAAKYNVRSIPKLIIVKDGTVVEEMVGFQSKEVLKEKLEKHI